VFNKKFVQRKPVKLSPSEAFKPLLRKVRKHCTIAQAPLAVKAVLFDFDGTLANSLELGYEVMDILCQKHGYNILPQDAYRTLGTRQVIREMGIPIWRLPRLMREGRRLMAERICEISPVEGIKEALSELDSLGLLLGVVTSNSGDNVKSWLTYHKLDNYFDVILGGGGLLRKERCIRRVMNKLNLKPNELLYVGDESRDIIACQHLGIQGVAVTWGLDLEQKLLNDNPANLIACPKELAPLVKTHIMVPLQSVVP
jgi:phosphoglycolate phosphatase-like HAD superfamily hydrolase